MVVAVQVAAVVVAKAAEAVVAQAAEVVGVRVAAAVEVVDGGVIATSASARLPTRSRP